MPDKTNTSTSILGDMKPSTAIVKLAVPATLALMAKAIYNIVDTAYIGMLDSDLALTAVGVTVPLLLIMVSIENIFAAGAAVLAGRQLGAKDQEGASRTVTTIVGLSMIRQGLFYIPFILILPRLFGVTGIYCSQPAADVLTIFVCLLSIKPMKRIASEHIGQDITITTGKQGESI